MTQTQNAKVLRYLTKGQSLTAKQARSRFGVQNLRARICELREEGHKIVTSPVTFRDTGARGVSYKLVTRKSR
jgi:hypothetical protein